jgi:glucose-1-phosphate adenylyltransferase
LYRMDYSEMVDAHIDRRADITIAAQPCSAEDATQMGIFRFDRDGRIVAFEEKPKTDRLLEIGQSIPQGATLTGHTPAKPFIASMGVYVFSRDVLLEVLAADRAKDFGREVIPAALDRYSVSAYLFRGFWADVGTVESFYEANIMLTRPGAPFKFYDAHRPIYTHPRFLPGSRFADCRVREAIVAEGCFLDRCSIEQSIVGIRTHVGRGAEIRRSVLLGADYFGDPERVSRDGRPHLGIGCDVVLDRVIVDKNARIGDRSRLVNEQGVQDADGDGYYIRNGIIVVPKDGTIAPGTVV